MQIPAKCGSEQLCYRFAGALLLPAERIKAELSSHRPHLAWSEVKDLKAEYGISMQAVLHRAHDLDIISDSAYGKWCRYFRQQGWRDQEPGHKVPRERPHWRRRVLQRALAEDLISEGRAAEIAGLPIKEIRQLGAGIEDATRN